MNLAAPIRAALLSCSAVASALGYYKGSPCVFTRQPIDDAAPYPMVLVSPDVVHVDQDMLNDSLHVIVRDILVYGQNGTAEEYRVVEEVAYTIRRLFHRQRHSVEIAAYRVVDIVASGPIPAPVDDAKTVGRVVTLTIRLTPQL